jgi:1-deoxy-D-xylulose-5-phosphate reductoisomerase
MRSVTILGSTGSIGTQALDVVRRNPERFKVVGLSAAGTNQELLVGQIREFLPPLVAIADEAAAQEVRDRLGDTARRVELLVGPQAGEQLTADTEADTILNGLVGSKGLGPTLVALQSGKTVALANKESLVVGGDLVMDLIKGEPERLLPVDSEHAALALALRGERREDLKRVVITGSGGPFRGWSATELSRASMKEALQHPVWSMGPKITIDSATLMNKGLEVIEAHHLFGTPYDRIDVVVHPQSIVHAVVSLCDGASLAHLGHPDMRVPIAYALHHPDRVDVPVPTLDLAAVGALTFEPPDLEAFPCLRLAREAAEAGGTGPCVLNAANEVAVHAFLNRRMGFMGIPAVIEQTLEHVGAMRVHAFDSLYAADGEARAVAGELVGALAA